MSYSYSFFNFDDDDDDDGGDDDDDEKNSPVVFISVIVSRHNNPQAIGKSKTILKHDDTSKLL